MERPSSQSKVNPTSLYVSTCRLVLQWNSDDPGCKADFCRLMPYLRTCLSCTVCDNLLIEPHTPTKSICQHHVCKECIGGKKNRKPTCGLCTDYSKYLENIQLRVLLQCYKKLCDYVMNSTIYRYLAASSGEGFITDLIDEGAAFKDEFESNAGLSKSAYSILPCIYNANQTNTTLLSDAFGDEEDPATNQNGSSLYSVMYAGSGNKMVIKRKVDSPGAGRLESIKGPSFKRPVHRRSNKARQSRSIKEQASKTPEKKQRLGCRCGNATVTPGKLTCCGQRCPCYVMSKACLDCKCRGCRNPHTKEGQKIIRDLMSSKTSGDDDLDSDMLQMADLDDLDHLEQVLELRDDTTHELDIL